ncbi:MAG TPA: ABC transporter permease [Vicinamibacterales bacterium]|nr:ABC transporter permease [Vicinamibacterales bacterium]
MLDLAELWEYRELLFFFVWRDVKVRYKQTVLGAAWAVIQPLTTTFAFTILFGNFGGMAKQVQGPYALHVFVAMLPWTFFANAMSLAANSLVGSSHLISKVYFPRILIPIAAIASGLIDFAISFVVLLIMMAAYHVAPSWPMLLLPLYLLGTIVSAAGAGILFAALIVTYRDVRYVMTFVMQLWLFGTPVLYSLDIIPAKWHALYALNPMVGMIAGFRACVLGGPVPAQVILISSVSAVLMFVAGIRYFLQVERRFADVI